MKARLNHLVLVRRATIQFLRGFEHLARRMIDATAIAAEIDAIDYSSMPTATCEPHRLLAPAQCTASNARRTAACRVRSTVALCLLDLR